MILYRIITSQDSALRQMGEEGWILSCISEGKMYFWKQQSKERRSGQIVTSSGFEQWYRLYPNKKARKDAEVMWNRLSEKEQELAIEGIKRYVVYWKKKNMDKQYMPHPATWLNARRWEDNLSETVDIQPTQNEERIKKEIEEQRKNEKEKKELDERIAKCRANPEEWKKINELAYSQLTEEQRNSTVKDALIKVKIRTILSNYK